MTAPAPPRRADAQRNIDKILTATQTLLAVDPHTSTETIAKAAGVARVTLYGHFPSRADLLQATLDHVLTEGEQTLNNIDLDGDPRDAMTRLLTTSWTLVAASSAVLTAAEGVIGTDTLRQLHDQPARRVEQLIRRGQTAGVFTTDLPLTWLVSAVHYLIHGASIEVRAGRLDPNQAGPTLTISILAILSSTPSTGDRHQALTQSD